MFKYYFIFLASLIDAILTPIWFHFGIGEANPVMETVIKYNVVLFFLIKMFMTSSGLYLLWKYSHHELSSRAIKASTTVFSGTYLAILLVHGYIFLSFFKEKLESLVF